MLPSEIRDWLCWRYKEDNDNHIKIVTENIFEHLIMSLDTDGIYVYNHEFRGSRNKLYIDWFVRRIQFSSSQLTKYEMDPHGRFRVCVISWQKYPFPILLIMPSEADHEALFRMSTFEDMNIDQLFEHADNLSVLSKV